ncbi:hypothetical protein MLD38_016769 [Melastoma candidum]|uniref:Uncharacterized protein n=1 Tax=Melastoma candidum TaxID=119954 RepID=A0ACB9QWQ3_9MYRT|nr:hypothetical protein MLD38_016769 [Melastoma candidum]
MAKSCAIFEVVNIWTCTEMDKQAAFVEKGVLRDKLGSDATLELNRPKTSLLLLPRSGRRIRCPKIHVPLTLQKPTFIRPRRCLSPEDTRVAVGAELERIRLEQWQHTPCGLTTTELPCQVFSLCLASFTTTIMKPITGGHEISPKFST